MEQSSVPGTLSAWPDVLHDGYTPLATGEAWIRARCAHLRSFVPEPDDEILRQYRAGDAMLESWRARDEVVFWLEHDLFDQLLLIRHLWWLTTNAAERAASRTRFSLVCGREYIGLMKPEQFGPRFAARQPITAAQIRIGAAAWEAFCSGEPTRLLPFAADHAEHAAEYAELAAEPADHAAEYADHADGAKYPDRSAYSASSAADLPFLPAAIRRLLEEFPAAANGLARSERQILEVLSEGSRTPEQTFVAASRLEEAIYMGDLGFWDIVQRLRGGAQPLVTADVQPRPGRLPDGTLHITNTGRAVLAGRADQVALNGISRWLGGAWLSADHLWRWTGSSLQPAP